MSYGASGSERQGGARVGIGKWAAAFAFVIALGLTLVSLQLFQLTSRRAAEPALRSALNALVEGDAVIERNYDDLQARAEASQSDDVLELREYPVSIPLTRDEALSTTKADLRRILLDRAVERMYDDGASVLRRHGDVASPGRFTSAGLTGRSIGFLRGGVHGTLLVLTLVLAGISALLAVVLVSVCRGFGRAVAIGLCVLFASLPLLLVGLGARAYTRGASDSDGEYLRGELMGIAAELSWAPVRNGLAFSVLGVAILALGIICARWSDGRNRYGAA